LLAETLLPRQIQGNQNWRRDRCDCDDDDDRYREPFFTQLTDSTNPGAGRNGTVLRDGSIKKKNLRNYNI